MKVTLETIGVLDEIIKVKEVSFEEEKVSLDRFFRVLVERYGPIVGEHLLPEGTFSSQYFILINGLHIKQLKKLQTELRDGDKVLVYTAISGG